MSRLEELIQQYCPDGVEYVKFEDIFDTITDYTAAGSFKSLADNVKYLKIPDYAMLIRTTDIKSNFSKGDFIYISKSAYDYLWRVKLDKECIVLPNVGNCGEVYYIKPDDLPYENCALAPNAILVRSSIFNNRFLNHE
jgi:type I restriction enzyme S subunit